MFKYKCIGGTREGNWYSGNAKLLLELPEKSQCYCADTYRLEHIDGKDKSFYIWVHSSLTLDDALDIIFKFNE